MIGLHNVRSIFVKKTRINYSEAYLWVFSSYKCEIHPEIVVFEILGEFCSLECACQHAMN
jgi:hypothetical protein